MLAANTAYTASLLRHFSTFVDRQNVAPEVAQVATRLWQEFVAQKSDLADWSVTEVDFFLTQHPNHPAGTLLTQFVQQQPPFQVSAALDEYLLALSANGCSHSTVKNYRSDINQFADFAESNQLNSLISKPKVQAFLSYQLDKGLKPSSITRKLVSITQFALWATQEGWLDRDVTWLEGATLESLTKEAPEVKLEPTEGAEPEAIARPQAETVTLPLPPKAGPAVKPELPAYKHAALKPTDHKTTVTHLSDRVEALQRQIRRHNTWQWLMPYFNLALLVLFLLGLSFLGYRQFFVDAPANLAYPSAVVRPNRELSFQGRLTDTAENPIITATNMRFYLFDTGPGTGGTQLWDSGTCSVTPDQDGIFNVGLGDDCGSEIPEDVFSENANVWLQVQVAAETLTPRQPIRTVPYALNSETVQGFPVNSTESATVNTLLVMNESGQVVLGETNPMLKSVSGTFTIEGQAVTIQTTSGSNGNIVLDADGIGGIILRDYLHAPGATLSATYAGGVPLTLMGGPSGTGDLLTLQNSSGTELTAFNNVGDLEFAISSDTTRDIKMTGAGAATIRLQRFSGTDFVNFYTNGGRKMYIGSAITAQSNFLPDANNTYAIGSSGARFSNVYSQLLNVAGATTFNGVAYTWPAADGSSSYILSTNGSGTLSWADPSALVGASTYWNQTNGAVYPKNSTVDLLVGGTSTASAKFAFLNVNSGTPTASIAGSTTGYGLYMTGDGSISTTLNRSLTLNPNGGNVGIATTSPIAPLDVNGTAYLERMVLREDSTYTSTTTNAQIYQSGGHLYIAGESNFGRDIYLQTNNATRLTIKDSSGNVGIGTTSPLAKLGINGDLSANSATISATYANSIGMTLQGTTTPGGWMRLTSSDPSVFTDESIGQIDFYSQDISANGTGVGSYIKSIAQDAGTQYALTFGTGVAATGATERLRIDYQGNVSIGTTSPLATLDVRGQSGTLPVASVSGQTSFAAMVVDNKGLGDIFTASSSGLNRFVITQNGNVGIGTTTPSYLLDVNGTARVNNTLRIRNSSFGTDSTIVQDASGNLTLTAGTHLYLATAGGSWGIDSSTAQLFRSGVASGSLGINNGATTTLNLENASGGQVMNVVMDGALTVGSTTTLNGLTYTWPGSQTANYILQTNGSGTLSWVDPAGAAAASIYWNQTNGLLYPKNSTVDVTFGGQSTASAKFAFMNVNSGTPTASIAGSTTGYGLYMTGDGTIATTLNRSLLLNPDGGRVGIGTNSPTEALHVNGNIRVGQDSRLVMNGASTTITHNGTTWLQPYYNSGYNTAIYSGNSGTTPKMVILSGGNVGIGSTSPTALLDVAGTASISGNLTIGNGAVIRPAYGPLKLQYKSAANSWGDALTIQDTTGNVSIGTSPNYNNRLHVQGSSTNNAVSPNALYSIMGYAPSADSATFAMGAQIIGQLSGTANMTGSWGSGGLIGVNGKAVNVGSGTVTNAYGMLPTVQNTGVGTITNAYSLYIPDVYVPSGTITNSYGLYIANQTAAGTLDYAIVTNAGHIVFNEGGDASTDLRIEGDTDVNLFFADASADGIGIGTSSPLAKLDVRGTIGTIPVASISGQTSFAAMVVDNKGVGDIFTASVSGARKLTILNSGDLQLHNFSNNGGILYTDGSGVVAQTTVGSAGECLKSIGGGTPTWGACGSGSGSSNWRLANGALSPINDTLDILIGSAATASAKFAFMNVNSGTPTASISGSSAGFGTYLTGDGTLATTLNRSLLLNPTGGNVGIGTTAPAATLDVAGTAYIRGNAAPLLTIERTAAGNAEIAFINSGGTSYAGRPTSGMFAVGANADLQNSPAFYITTSGNVGIGTTAPGARLAVNNDFFAQAATISATYAGGVPLRLKGGPSGTANILDIMASDNQSLAYFGAESGDSTNFRILYGGSSVFSYIDLTVANNSSVLTMNRLSNGSDSVIRYSTNGSAIWNVGQLAAAANESYFIANGTAQVFTIEDQSLANSLYIDSTRMIGLGTSSPLATLDVRGHSGTLPVASVSGQTSFAAMVVDNSGVGDIFAASSSGLNRMVISQNGTVGIGTTLPSSTYKLDVFHNQTDPSSTVRGINSYTNITATSANTNAALSILGTAQSVPSSGITHNATNYAGYFQALKTGAGTTTTMIGVNALVDNTAGGGTITQARGVNVNITQTSGTVAAGYGVFVNDIVASNDYGIYQNGADDTNYFAGNVGIGSVTPGNILDMVRDQNSGTYAWVQNADSGAAAFSGYRMTTNGGTSYIYRTSTAYAAGIADDTVIQDQGGGDIVMYGAAEVARFLNGGGLQLGGAFNAGGLTGVAYNAISDSGTASFASTDDDLFIEDILEVNGSIYLQGKQLSPTSLWQNTLNVFHPGYEYASVADLVLGGTSTASAKFAFYNVNSGTPTASISANSSGHALFIQGDGTIATALNKSLLLNPDGGNVGIGTTNATSKLTIGGSSSVISNSSGDITFNSASGLFDFSGDAISNFSTARGTNGTAGAPTFSFTSDTDTGMFLSAVGTLGFTVGGTEHAALNSSGYFNAQRFMDTANSNYYFDPAATDISLTAAGKVGLGTTAPIHRLQVTGAITGKALVAFNETGDQDIFAASSSGTTRLRISNAGHLLPGADDSYDLGSSTARFRDLYLGPASVHMGTNGNEGTIGYDTSNSRLVLGTNGTTRMYIDNATGHASIGTTPSTIYEFVASNNAGTDSTSNTYGLLGQTVGTYSTASLTNTQIGILGNAQLTVNANSPAVNAYGVYGQALNSGTSTLGSGVGVQALVQNTSTGTITNGYGTLINMSAGSGTITTGYGIYIGDIGATTDYGIYQAGSNDDNYFAAGTNMFPNIGSSAGNRAVCFIDSNGAISKSATTCTNPSSLRFKENISNLNYGLDDLMNLRPVAYNFKSSFSEDMSRKIGFIAEEVEGVIPELVQYDATGTIVGLEYDKLTSLNTKAIQELAVQVNTLAGASNPMTLNEAGLLTITNAETPSVQVATPTGSLITNVQAFLGATIGQLKAGFIRTQSLLADVSVRSPQVETDLISPLNGTDITIELGNESDANGQLTITNTDDQTVASIDSQGNATFSGEITAQSSRLQQLEARLAEVEAIKAQTAEIVNATISGTLYADDINNFEQKVADSLKQPSLLEQLINDSQASVSASLASLFNVVDGAGYATGSGSLNKSLEELNLGTDDVTLGATALFVNQYFEVNGTAYVADSLGVGNQLLIGQGTHISDGIINYVNSADPDNTVLHIQPAGKGTLSLLAGLMTLNDNGQVIVNGDLIVNGNLAVQETLLTDLISPTDFVNPLQVQLATKSGEVAGATTESRFEIINELGTPVATISAQGKASFSSGLGVGAEDLTATTSGTVATQQTSGKATVKAFTTQVVIKTDKISENSLIYVTPVGSTGNQVLYVKQQTIDNPSTPEVNEAQFVVGFDTARSQDTTFNWWIVN